MILLKEAWSRVRDEGVGVMGDFIGKPFTATTMSELNYLVIFFVMWQKKELLYFLRILSGTLKLLAKIWLF